MTFIVSPFWSLGTNVYYQTITFFVIVFLGWIWSRVASANICIKFQKPDYKFLFSAGLLVLLFNFRALTNSISFLGDEIQHLIKPFMINKMVGAPIIFCGTGLLATCYYFAFKKIKHFTLCLTGFLIICSVILFTFFFDESLWETFHMYLVRYPFLPTVLSAIPASIVGTFGDIHHEFAYRLVPLICMFLTGWYGTNQFFKEASFPKRILVFCAIITVPSIFYYTSILYLEPLILLLTLVVLNNIQPLISKNLNEDTAQNMGWLCLLFLGFIKETVAPILVGFLFVRGLKWLFNKNHTFSSFWKEAQIAIGLLLPLALYLWFRGEVRGFNFDPSGAFDPAIYKIFFLTIWEQFGLILPIGIGSFIFLKSIGLWERIFIVVTSLITFAFYLLDFGGIFIGYSRFNLFFLPFVLFLFCKGLQIIKNEWIVNITLGLLIVSNLYMSPINLDGSRNLSWERCIDCSNMSVDMVYPMKESFLWLSQNFDKQNYDLTILKHRKYYYPFKEFYFEKFKWKPTLNIESVEDEYFINRTRQIIEKQSDKKQIIIIQPDKNWVFDQKQLKSDRFEIKEFTNKTLPIYIIFEK